MTTLRIKARRYITDARGRVWQFHDVASGKKGGAASPAQDAVKRIKAVLQPLTRKSV
jgi:hypothetical protein